MVILSEELAGDIVTFNYVETLADAKQAYRWARRNKWLALDTESTGLNCYHPSWRLRMFQFGDDTVSYVIPARFREAIRRIILLPINWIAHNGPHDIRSIDKFLGFDTGVVCVGETYIPCHHADPRGRLDGGVAHGLKEQCIAHIDRTSGRWEIRLKKEFKKLTVPMPGQFYKSGIRKGQPKFRRALLSEGWRLIDEDNPAYIAYAAADPVLTFRLWQHRYQTVKANKELYLFDFRVEQACDRLHRRAIKLDVKYTTAYRERLDKQAQLMQAAATELGCPNVFSGAQIELALRHLGVRLTEKTAKGAYKTDEKVLHQLAEHGTDKVRELIGYILRAKQYRKRREAYADAMLREMDAQGRIHPSINSLAARTARMSVSRPALQQLPTKENEE